MILNSAAGGSSVSGGRDRAGAPDVGTLTGLLFADVPGGACAAPLDDVHGHWRKAVSTDLFRHRCGTERDRWALAYARLRALNEELVAPELLPGDVRALTALHEWAAAVDGATATVAGIHYNVFLGSLSDDVFSPPRDLSSFFSLDRVGVFLCAERAHGAGVATVRTTARYDPGSGTFTLHTPHEGAAKWLPDAGTAGGPRSAVVAARLLVGEHDHGVFLFVADLTDGGGPLPGVRVAMVPARAGGAVERCVAVFEHVRLPRTALVQGPHGQLEPDGSLTASASAAPDGPGGPVRGGRERVPHAVGRVAVGALCAGASALGGSRAALAVAVRRVRPRAGAAPGADGRGVPAAEAVEAADLGPLLRGTATAYAMTFLLRGVTARWLHPGPGEGGVAEREARIAKAWIAGRARELMVVARAHCPGLDLLTVPPLRFAAAVELIFGHEVAPEAPAATGAEDLADPSFLHGLLVAKERHSHLRARVLLRGASSGAALGPWNSASRAALDLVGAYGARLAAEDFVAACSAPVEGPTRTVLRDLCALFLLGQVRPYGELLLTRGALTATQVEAVPGVVRVLGRRLEPWLVELTEAFGVPEGHVVSAAG
ncbi:acyl-CoA dehydrogenase [Streptomyces sp. NPDC001941]|uniref:acyl-CoA dehydrogenase n=1 Tax=Streptomyces sp. NPDC001941 TaxID=3154659 RepID=UPI00332C8AFB